MALSTSYFSAAYLAEDYTLAIENNHQTAESAAQLALEGNVKQLHLFHHSRRYQNLPDAVELFKKQTQNIFPRPT